MTVLGFDLWNRANADSPGSDSNGNAHEEASGDYDILSGSLVQTDATGTPGLLRIGTDIASATQWVEARLDQSDGSGQMGLAMRVTGTGGAFTCILVEVADGAFKLVRATAGSPDTDASVGPAHAHAAGNVYAADIDGSGTVRAYLNGILQHTWTSQSHAAGNTRVGLHLNESASGAVRFGRLRFGNGAYPGPDVPVFIAQAARVAAGTTTAAMTYPASSVAAGRLAVAHRAIKPSTATATAEGGWDQEVNVTGGGGAQGTDTGPSRISVDIDELAGGEGNPTFDQASTPNAVTGGLIVYDKPVGTTWSYVSASGADGSVGTGWSATAGATLDLQPGDIVLALSASATDATTAYTAPAITAAGITFGQTVPRYAAGGAGTGQDVGNHVYEAIVEEGTATVAPVLTLTGGPSSSGPTAFVRLRAASAGASESATPGALTLTPVAATTTPGATSVAATPGQLTATPVAATAVPGATSVAATPGTLTAVPVAATATPGATSVAATPGTLALAAVAATATPGPTSAAATTGTLTLAPVPALLAAAVAADPGQLTLQPVAAATTPGPTSVTAEPGLLTLAPVAAQITGAVAAEPGLLALQPVAATATPGPTSVAAIPGLLTLQPVPAGTAAPPPVYDGTTLTAVGAPRTLVAVPNPDGLAAVPWGATLEAVED